VTVLRVLAVAAQAQLRHVARDLFMLFSAVLQPFFIGVTVMYMLRGRPDFDPVYVVVGAGLSGLWTVALFEGNWSIGRERWQGTLELLVAAPVPLMVVLAGKTIGSMLFSLVSIATTYVIGAWLFGYDVGVRDPAGFAVSFALGLASLWSIAMLLAPIGILWRTAGRLVNILEYPVYIFAGFMFPVLLLPGALVPISYALPPYWAAVALHGTSSGTIAAAPLAFAWMMLVATSVAIVLLSARLHDLVLDRARRAGTLALS
jgi:ABC-2 type transport system permease protein